MRPQATTANAAIVGLLPTPGPDRALHQGATKPPKPLPHPDKFRPGQSTPVGFEAGSRPGRSHRVRLWSREEFRRIVRRRQGRSTQRRRKGRGQSPRRASFRLFQEKRRHFPKRPSAQRAAATEAELRSPDPAAFLRFYAVAQQLSWLKGFPRPPQLPTGPSSSSIGNRYGRSAAPRPSRPARRADARRYDPSAYSSTRQPPFAGTRRGSLGSRPAASSARTSSTVILEGCEARYSPTAAASGDGRGVR